MIRNRAQRPTRIWQHAVVAALPDEHRLRVQHVCCAVGWHPGDYLVGTPANVEPLARFLRPKVATTLQQRHRA